MKQRFAIAAGFLALFGTGGPSRAAGTDVNPSKTVSETSSVALVEVPVTVVDSNGKPIRGLTAADFEVKDAGKLATVQSLDANEFRKATSSEAPGAAPSAPIDAAARRRFLLMFDLSYAPASALTRIREAAHRFVSDELAPADLAAAATYSVQHGFDMLVTFTSDRAQLASAIDTLGLNTNIERTPDPLQLGQLLGVSIPSDAQQYATINAKHDDPEDSRQMALKSRTQDESFRRGRVRQQLQTFGALARALNSVAGRKQVILFSGGFDMRLLQGLDPGSREALDQAEESATGQTYMVNTEERFGNSELQSGLNDMLDVFKHSDCVIHAVDVNGLKPSGSSNVDGADPSAGSGKGALFAMTDGTGGKLFENANNFNEQLDRLLEEQSVVYVLTFAPRLTGHPDKFHDIKVKVNRSGARVSARSGYFEPRPFSAVSAVERRLSAADVITAEIPVTDIGASIVATAFPGKDSASVPVVIHVASLPGASGAGRLPIELYGYAFDSQGAVGDFFTESATLDLARVGTQLSQAGLSLYAGMKLAPGEYRLKVLVREGATGKMGFQIVPLTVPDASKAAPYLVPPIFVNTTVTGILLRAKSARSARDAEGAFPFMQGADPYLPATSPSVAAGGEARICLYAYHFGDGARARLAGQVLDRLGKPVGPASLTLAGRIDPDADGRATFQLAFKAVGLSPGDYSLRVLMQDPDSGAARQATSPFSVR